MSQELITALIGKVSDKYDYNTNNKLHLDDKRLRYAFSRIPRYGSKTKERVNYQQEVEMDSSFNNPCALQDMIHAMQIHNLETYTLLPDNIHIDEDKYYESFRELQNKAWAEERLRKGVAHAKEKRFKEAISYYDSALSTHINFPDGYTARGAAYANLNQIDKAQDDLIMALKLDPEHPNAKVYLQAIYDKNPNVKPRLIIQRKEEIKTMEYDTDDPDTKLKAIIKKDGIDKVYDILQKKEKKHHKKHKKKRKRSEDS